MDQTIRLIAATETTPALANELGGWFEAEFGPPNARSMGELSVFRGPRRTAWQVPNA